MQTYLKKLGQDGGADKDDSDGVGGTGRDPEREREREEEAEDESDHEVEDLMRHDISDLLEQQQLSDDGVKVTKQKRHKKKQQVVEEAAQPPLISFDEDEPQPVSVPVASRTAAEGSPRARAKNSSNTSKMGYGSTGYGSTSYGSTAGNQGKKKDDWSGDWGDSWTGGGVATSSASESKSTGGWDDWNNDDGWSTVDLRHKSD